jgi:hypothetical protein
VAKTGFLEFGHVIVDTLNVWIFRNFCTTWGIARAFQQEKSLRKQMFQSRDMRFFKNQEEQGQHGQGIQPLSFVC